MKITDLFFKKKSSGDVAKDRLKLLLVSDRANCSPEIMEMIKNDIIQVISNIWKLMLKVWTSRLLRRNQMETMVVCQLYSLIFRLRI